MAGDLGEEGREVGAGLRDGMGGWACGVLLWSQR